MESDLREYCLKWNNHNNNFMLALDSLLENEKLVDTTLAAEGQFINVHRIVLFACSQYFEELLSQLPDKQAVVFLKDVQFVDLKALVDFMYKGEVNVSQDRLDIFLQTAESLKIKGLAEKQQHKKFTASLPENFIATGTKARMNGLKTSQLLPHHTNSHNLVDSSHSPTEIRSSPPPEIRNASLNEMKEEEDEDYEEEEEMESGGVVVADMEPDEDHFVSVYGKRDNNIDSEFGDDHFEATENWSTQDADDEYWSNSHEGLNNTDGALVNCTNGGHEMVSPVSDADGSAGTSKLRRKRKSLSSATPSPSAKGRRRMKPKVVEYEYEYENNESKEPRTPMGGATVNGAGVTTCSCGRSYSKRKNYIRHITFECGKEPRFECEFKDCTARFKRKDNLKGHMDRVHLSCTSN